METTTTTNFANLANIFTNNDSASDTSVTVADESNSQELPDTPIETKESKEELNAPEKDDTTTTFEEVIPDENCNIELEVEDKEIVYIYI